MIPHKNNQSNKAHEFSNPCFMFHIFQTPRNKNTIPVQSISQIFKFTSDSLRKILQNLQLEQPWCFSDYSRINTLTRAFQGLQKQSKSLMDELSLLRVNYKTKFSREQQKNKLFNRKKLIFLSYLLFVEPQRQQTTKEGPYCCISFLLFWKNKIIRFLGSLKQYRRLFVTLLLLPIVQPKQFKRDGCSCQIEHAFSTIRSFQTSSANLPAAMNPIYLHLFQKKPIRCQLNLLIRLHCNIQLQQYFSKLRKVMQKPSYCQQILTKTSIQSQKWIKPCLKYENMEKKSIIIKEESRESIGEEISGKDHPKILEDQNDSLSDDSLDSDILEEHKAVIEVLFRENSIPLSYSHLIMGNQKQTQKSIESPIFKQITLQHYLSILLEKLKLSKPSLVRLFNSFLQEEKTCYRFMQHLYYSYPANIVDRVFKYIFYVWELYYPCLRRRLEVDEVISISRKISEKIFRCDIASKTHPENAREENRPRLHKLIKVFTLTFVLVMERCFANPYFKPSRLIGQQSDEQTNQVLQFTGTGRKIIKQDSLSLSS